MARARCTINIPSDLVAKFEALGKARWLEVEVRKADVERDGRYGNSNLPKAALKRACDGSLRGRPVLFPNGTVHTTVTMAAEYVSKFRELGHSAWLRHALIKADVKKDAI